MFWGRVPNSSVYRVDGPERVAIRWLRDACTAPAGDTDSASSKASSRDSSFFMGIPPFHFSDNMIVKHTRPPRKGGVGNLLEYNFHALTQQNPPAGCYHK